MDFRNILTFFPVHNASSTNIINTLYIHTYNTHAYIHTYNQTHKPIACIQSNICTYRQTYVTHTCIHTYIQTTDTHTHTDRQTDRPTDRQAYRQTYVHLYIHIVYVCCILFVSSCHCYSVTLFNSSYSPHCSRIFFYFFFASFFI